MTKFDPEVEKRIANAIEYSKLNSSIKLSNEPNRSSLCAQAVF